MRKLALFCLFLIISFAGCQNQQNENIANTERDVNLNASATIPIETPTPIPTPVSYTPEEVEPELLITLGNGVISDLYYSPDGSIIAYGDKGVLRWYDAITLEEIGNLEIADSDDYRMFGIYNISFSPDSRMAIVEIFSGWGTALIVDLALEEIISTVQEEIVRAPVLSSNGKYVAYIGGTSTSGGAYYNVSLWDTEFDGRAHHFPIISDNFSFLHEYFSAPAINPAETLVAAGSSEKIVYIWDLESGETLHQLDHSSYVSSVDFSADGRFLVSSCVDGLVRLWDAASGGLVKTLNRLDGDVGDVAFSPDGDFIGVAFVNSSLPQVAWDFTNDQVSSMEFQQASDNSFFETLVEQGYSSAGGSYVLFSPDHQYVALGTEHVLLWDLETHELSTWLENPSEGSIRGMAYSPDSRYIAAMMTDDTVVVWEVSSGESWIAQTEQLLPMMSVLYAGGGGFGPARGAMAISEQGLAFSPDGTKVVFANRTNFEIWDAANGVQLEVVEIPQEISVATNFSFSDDGSKLYVVLNRNRSALVWDVDDQKVISQIEFPPVSENAYTAVGLSGPLFARNNYKGGDHWIEFWNLDIETMQRLSVSGNENEPFRFSPDGRFLAAITDRKLGFWRLDTGEQIYVSSEEYPPTMFEISADATMIGMHYNGKLELYDITEISELPVVKAQTALGGSRPGLPGEEAPTPVPEDLPFPTSEDENDTPVPEDLSLLIFSDETGIDNPGVISFGTADEITEFHRFSNGRVLRAQWALDGESIFISSSQGVYQYRPDFSEVSRFEPGGRMTQVGFNQDGEQLAVGIDDDSVKVWNIDDGQVLFAAEGDGQPSIGLSGSRLVFSTPDGSELFTWEIASGEQLVHLPSSWAYSYNPIFSPNGEYVAAIQGNDSIRIWDSETGQIVNGLGIIDGELYDVRFSADSQYVIGAGGSYAYIWTVEPGNNPIVIKVIEGRGSDPVPGTVIVPDTLTTNSVTTAALSPDGYYLAAGTGTGQIYLFDLVNNTKPKRLDGHTGILTELEFNPNGTRLLSVDSDGTVMVWSVSSGQRFSSLEAFSGYIEGLTLRQDGNLTAWTENSAWVISPLTGNVVHTTRQYTGTIYDASPDGKYLAVYNPIHMELWNLNGELAYVFPDDAKWTLGRIEDIEDFFSAAFSPDGSKLFTVGSGGLWVHDILTRELITTVPRGPYWEMVSVSPDGNQIAACESGPYGCWGIVGYNLADANPFSFSSDYAFDDTPVMYKFSPNNQYLAAVTYGWENPGRLVIWEMSGSNKLVFAKVFPGSELTSLAFSPDGTLIAIGRGDGVIDLISTLSTEVVVSLSAHDLAVKDLEFSPGGLFLASAGFDGTVRIWGVP